VSDFRAMFMCMFFPFSGTYFVECSSFFSVIGRCGGEENKRMTTQNRQKSNVKKKEKERIMVS